MATMAIKNGLETKVGGAAVTILAFLLIAAKGAY